MTEKTDFPTDQQTGFDTQSIGTDPQTGLPAFRRFWKLEADIILKQGIIWYHEWKIAKDGKIYEELFETKNYIVVDIQPSGNDPGSPRYSNWFGQLAPVLAPAINDVIKNQLPVNCSSNIVP